MHEGLADLAIAHLEKSIQLLSKDLEEKYHPVKMRLDLAQAYCLSAVRRFFIGLQFNPLE